MSLAAMDPARPVAPAPRPGCTGAGQPPPGPLRPRGPLSAWLLHELARAPHRLAPMVAPLGDPLLDEDEVLSLYLCYELSYRGLPGTDEEWEWEPSLLSLRRSLEHRLTAALRRSLGTPTVEGPVSDALREMATGGGGPSLSRHMAERGSLEDFRQFAIHRSAYQLKEADPHSFGIARLHGAPKAALVRIQSGEYGDGDPTQVHATLFAQTMEALGLDSSYGAYLDAIPAVTLTTVNLMSMFGLHRRWRGALVGHLAIFEMCSVGPNGAYASALRRLGFDDAAARFYDVHVEADEVHQHLAAHDLADGLAALEPALRGDIVFGARALSLVERAFTAHLLGAWGRGKSSLRPSLAAAA